MTRRRFRWTRDRYRKAESLSRYFSRHIYDLPSEPPALVQELFDLWNRHPQRDDPLTRPLWQRACDRGIDDGIPF